MLRSLISWFWKKTMWRQGAAEGLRLEREREGKRERRKSKGYGKEKDREESGQQEGSKPACNVLAILAGWLQTLGSLLDLTDSGELL